MHLDFCNLEKSKQQQRDSKMTPGDSNENNVIEDVNSTDSDKAAGSSSGSNNYSGKYLRNLFLYTRARTHTQT